MHDVAKPALASNRGRSVLKTTLRWVVGVVAFVILLVALKALKFPVMGIVAIAFVAVAAAFGALAFRSFRGGRTIRGAIFGVLCVFALLLTVKTSQFNKMMSSPFAMPPTTVASAVVKEEDWAPTLSAVGSVSAVQGAVVAAELGGVVAEIHFQNGGEAKKGDVLVKLAAPSEDADLDLARNDLERTRDLAKRRVISKAELDAAESKFKQK